MVRMVQLIAMFYKLHLRKTKDVMLIDFPKAIYFLDPHFG